MGEKITSICMTAFMLVMCTGLIIMLQFVRTQNELELSLQRVDQSVISNSGEVEADSGVEVSAEVVISAVVQIEKIDTSREYLDKEKIYDGYIIQLDGVILTTSNVGSLVELGSRYIMQYDLDNKVIKIQRV